MFLSQKINGKIISTSTNISFDITYDVIVAGLGTAGAIAAIVAGECGMSVLCVETFSCMGGIGTAGAVTGYYFGSPGGIFEDIDRIVSHYNGTVYTKCGSINPESKKYVLERTAIDNGAKLMYDSIICGVFLDEKKVIGVQVLTDGKIKAVGCRVLIDSTGDAYVCEIAGCSYDWGRESDGRTQPFTSVCAYLKNGMISSSNFDSGVINQSNVTELSQAIISSHAVHKTVVGDEENPFLYCAPLIGVRDGRRIIGEDSIVLSDFFEGKVTNEPVFYAYADLDKHGWDIALESDLLQDWVIGANLGAVNVTIPVSKGILIPKGFDGILVSGRSMSLDRDISTCVRMIRDMQKAGEVAAVMAKVSIEDNIAIKNVPYDKILSHLSRTKCYDDENNQGYKFDSPLAGVEKRKIVWLTDELEIKEALSTEKPGVGIWSCRLLGDKVKASLMRWLNNENENLRKHSSFALAHLNATEALPIIRDIINERDSVILKDCRKHNQARINIAIFFAGRLADAELIDTIIKIISDPQEIQNPLYQNPIRDGIKCSKSWFNINYLQTFSIGVMALIRIGNVIPESRDKIKAALANIFSNIDYISRITNLEKGSPEQSMLENIKNIVKKHKFY